VYGFFASKEKIRNTIVQIISNIVQPLTETFQLDYGHFFFQKNIFYKSHEAQIAKNVLSIILRLRICRPYLRTNNLFQRNKKKEIITQGGGAKSPKRVYF